jgi:hypothetical protein
MDDPLLTYGFFPLYGLQYEGDLLELHQTVVFQFELFEWRDWEDSDIFHEHLDEAAALEHISGQGASSWPFTRALRRVKARFWTHLEWKNPLPYGVGVVEVADITNPWPALEPQAMDVVLALRLHKSGAFMDPQFFGIYARREDGANSRRPGLYRQKAYDLGPDGLELYFREPGYILEKDDQEVLDLLAAELAAQRGERTSHDLGLQNFGYSFAPMLDDHARLALLFTALEIIFGGFDNRVGKAGFIERAVAAARFGNAANETLGSFMTEDARKLRNIVAHSGPEALPSDSHSAVNMLSAVVRAALLCRLRVHAAMRHSIDHVTEVTRHRTLPIHDAFNRVVAAAVADDQKAVAILSSLE